MNPSYCQTSSCLDTARALKVCIAFAKKPLTSISSEDENTCYHLSTTLSTQNTHKYAIHKINGINQSNISNASLNSTFDATITRSYNVNTVSHI